MTTPEALFTLFVALAAFALGAHWERRREWEWLERQRTEAEELRQQAALAMLFAASQPEKADRVVVVYQDSVHATPIGGKN